jgi:predicted ATPase with chaperone activity
MGFQLTDAGKARALDALGQSEYFGAMPVPLRLRGAGQAPVDPQHPDHPRPADRRHGPPDPARGLLGQLGPAVSSGRSVLMYGPPGNGKSSISNGIRAAMGDTSTSPTRIEYAGQVITVYDPIVHTKAEAGEAAPGSARCAIHHAPRHALRALRAAHGDHRGRADAEDARPGLQPDSRTYQAPLQLKSTGGVFIVDDLGRQEEPPQALINRWIVPLEEGKDILALQSGEKFEVPFDTLVIFSTNFHPNEIFDQAALRRIFFKIKIDGPSQRISSRSSPGRARKRHAADEPR